MAKDPALGFKIGESVLYQHITYQLQTRRAVTKNIYELWVDPYRKCNVKQWINQEVNDYFGPEKSLEVISDKFWNQLLPNGTFRGANYSNGNKFSLFPVR